MAKQETWDRRLEGIDAAQLPGDKETEEGGFCLGAFRRMGAVTDFTGDDQRTERALGSVALGRERRSFHTPYCMIQYGVWNDDDILGDF